MTLALLIIGCSSVIMLSLGVIAEYLGRLFLEVKARPQPVIRLLVNEQRAAPRSWLGSPRDPVNRELGGAAFAPSCNQPSPLLSARKEPT